MKFEKYSKKFKNVFYFAKASNRIKGTFGVFLLSTIVLFSYQNCGTKLSQAASALQPLTVAPANVSVDIASLQDCANGGISIITYIDANNLTECIILCPNGITRRATKTGAWHWKHNGYSFD